MSTAYRLGMYGNVLVWPVMYEAPHVITVWYMDRENALKSVSSASKFLNCRVKIVELVDPITGRRGFLPGRQYKTWTDHLKPNTFKPPALPDYEP